jgi:hypothetical protein
MRANPTTDWGDCLQVEIEKVDLPAATLRNAIQSDGEPVSNSYGANRGRGHSNVESGREAS